MQRTAGFILLIIAYVLLYPGLNEPMLTVTGTIDKADVLTIGKQMLKESETPMGLVGDMATMIINNLKVEGSITAFDKTRSILETVQDLFASDNALVAILIVTFSVLVPVFKGFLTLISLLDLQHLTKYRLRWLSAGLSKWSMADVFVIGIFVAFLGASGIREDSGFIQFNSSLGPGFYYFLGYCLVSILASQLLANSYAKVLPRQIDTSVNPSV